MEAFETFLFPGSSTPVLPFSRDPLALLPPDSNSPFGASEPLLAAALFGGEEPGNRETAFLLGEPFAQAARPTPSDSVDPLTGQTLLLPGVFEVGESGEISADFLFDGGDYRGEVAIFSLEGMDGLRVGTPLFNWVAAIRSLSNSEYGRLLVSDLTEGALFSGNLGEPNFNRGAYLGEETFQMRPGDRVGFMLVPNSTVFQVYLNPSDRRPGRQPFYSFPSTDPSSHLQIAQIEAGLFGWEELPAFDRRFRSDRDYNDILFSVRGLTGSAVSADVLINPRRDWRDLPLGREIIEYATRLQDTTAPVLDAALLNDTGSSASDGITFAPGIGGTLSDDSDIAFFAAGFTPQAFTDVTASLNADGSFTFDRAALDDIFGNPLPDGTHTLSLQATDTAGNATTFNLPFTLDTVAPGAPTNLDVLDVSDTGSSNSDNITRDNSPFVALNAEAGSRVRLYNNGILADEQDTPGISLFKLAPLSEGLNAFTAASTDVAGNTSPISAPLTLTVDTTAPDPLTFTLDPSTDSGTIGDGITEFDRVSLVGQTAPDTAVTLDPTGDTTFADAAGTFRFENLNLELGDTPFTVRAVDDAGNESTFSQTLTRVETSGFTVMPGGYLELDLYDLIPDSETATFTVASDEPLPQGLLEGDGTLIFRPTPDEIGNYVFTILARDGETTTAHRFALSVVADPLTTTRISGIIENTDREPLAGVVVELGGLQTVTDADGAFVLEAPGMLPDDTLKVRGEAIAGDVTYPFIAEKLHLLLERDPITGVNNVIDRPIYLPPIDTANAVTIDPARDLTVTTSNIPGASVFVAAGSLDDQQGNPFTGELSITEVPREVTPAALPGNLLPDLVVTIQPGEMVFTEPAPLSLPNLSDYAPGTEMTLWSINPNTGDFDNVGTGRVSADGSVIETVEGGIRNSSWHFFAPLAETPQDLEQDSRNEANNCNECKAEAAGNSEIQLHSGAVIETHDLVPYSSQGSSRGLTLTYDSLRADPRPILYFGYDNVLADPDRRLMAELTVRRGDFVYQVPGFGGDAFGLGGGEHFWSIPEDGGSINAALQADLRGLPSGRYGYELDSGLMRLDDNREFLSGTTTTREGQFLHVNSIGSAFGNGWGLAGWQEIAENDDGSILLIDGDGGELLFEASEEAGDPYISPPGDFSTLEKLDDGTFRRTLKDQTVYTFNADNKLAQMVDRNGNTTEYRYTSDGLLASTTDPVGLETTFNYTEGRVTSIADPAGRITRLDYDAAGNLTRITDPDGTARTWDYDADFHMTEETDKRGNREQTSYDFAGRADRSILKDGATLDYDPLQVQGLYRPEQTLDPINAPLAFQLDTPTSTYTDANGNTITYTLDRAGQVVSATDEVGALPAVFRNSDNLITTRTDARGNVTAYTYDERGNVTGIRDSISGSGLIPVSAYPTNDNPESLATGDLNNDGNLDFVVAAGFNVSVYLGRGNGTFAQQMDFGTGSGAESVVLGDVNNDGIADIISGNQFDDSISVLLGNGDGTFADQNEIAVGSFPEFVAVGDIDNNGNLDITVANSGDDSVSVLLGDGEGGFATAGEIAVGDNPQSIVLGDFDSDGLLDLMAGNLNDDNASILRGNGDGTFVFTGTAMLGYQPLALALADLNGDGNLDAVASNSLRTNASGDVISGSSASVLLGNGDGTFAPQIQYEIGRQPETLALGDTNNDGILDILTGGNNFASNYVSVLLGNGDGTFASDSGDGVGNLPSAIAVGDFNNDENLDLLAADMLTHIVSISLGAGDGTFSRNRRDITLSVASPGEIAVGDINNDGNPDVVSANGSSIDSFSIFLGNDDGTLQAETTVSEGSPVSVALADVDDDGNLDLIGANGFDNTVSVLLGTGTGIFTPAQNLATVNNAISVVAADVSGDGILDLITASSQANSVSVFLGSGTGTFAEAVTYPVGDTPQQVIARDLDGDGDLDLATANYFDFTVTVLQNAGDGTFARSEDFAVAAPATSLQAADVDNDGAIDLLAGADNFFVGEVVVLFGNGDGTFARSRRFEVGEAPTHLDLGDVNADGDLDVVTVNRDDNTLSVLFGDGRGDFSGRQDYVVGITLRDLELTDLDDDGDLDFITALSFDDQGISISLNNTFGDPNSRRYTYDPTFNQLTSITDELGRQTRFDIDPDNGNILSTTQVIGEIGGGDDLTSTFTYTAAGLVDTITDPLGRITDYDYTTFGLLESMTVAQGTADEATQRFEYDEAGNQTAVIDENGNRTEFDYDDLNRLTRIRETDPDGPGALTSPVTEFTYDDAGNLATVTDALGNVTTNIYDELDRLGRVTDALNQITTFDYDNLGNLLSVIDPLGHQTTNRYDERNRLIETTDPDGGITQFGYDLDNNLTSVLDPTGNQTIFAYDARNRLVSETDPLGEITRYQYDLVDNLISRTDRNGRTIGYDYDDIDRLTQEIWEGTSQVIDYTYDEASNLTAIADEFSSLAFTYDNRDRVTAVDNGGTPNAPNVVLDYAYDDAGNLLSVADTINGISGGTNAYTYDDLNRLTRLTQTGNAVSDKRVDFGYNALGQYASLDRYANLGGTQSVVDTSFSYDALNRLENLTHRNASNPVAFYDFEYDAASRITQISDTDGSIDYTYDDRDQLIGADRSDPNNPDESYDYDANGNRTNSSLHGDGYETGDGNRLESDGTYNYEYDDEGNLIRKTEISTGSSQEFEWDYRNRLVAVVDKDASGDETQRVEFTYDAFDRRIAKEVDTNPPDAVPGEVTHFVYDGDDVLLEFVDDDGSEGTNLPDLVQRYLHGAGVDEILAQDDGSGGVLWHLTDHLGTVRDLVDNSGTVVNHLTYDSFGNVVSQTNSSIDTRYLFTGREFDEEIGLQYNRARYYDPIIGRFIGEDPIGFGGGDENLYRYVLNVPTLYNDPEGLFIPQAIGGLTSVLSGLALSQITGCDYDVSDALIDFGLGAAGVGVVSKLNKLNRIRKLRDLAKNKGLELKKKDSNIEDYIGENHQRLKIKLKPSKNATGPDSKFPRAENRISQGEYYDPFSQQGGTGKNAPGKHIPLEPKLNNRTSSGIGAGVGAATNGVRNVCGCD